eukprot:TRINITY_DN2943_c0_g2_i1.p1 TRINITY_DN2943_c0_g2~~TRINITY_DN2943_c0_g2_i1.p1  ORF type:complete len:465 (-),score=127.63 TRINITY_DN2943_c0_g2_i1:238-1632(-)
MSLMNPFADKFLKFINSSPSKFHVVRSAKQMLKKQGFVEVKEREDWISAVKEHKKIFFTRNQSALFAVAGNPESDKEYPFENRGYSITAGHTDAPCLRIKPVSKINKAGYATVGVETYGGGIWHTWFDRDLSVAGRVIVKGEKGATAKLISIDRPLMRVSSPAIHLDRTQNEKFKVDKEAHLATILSDTVAMELAGQSKNVESKAHHAVLMDVVAAELDCKVEDIMDFDLFLRDMQPSAAIGPFEEYISSGRLDNVAMSWCCLQGFIDACTEESLEADKNARVLCLYDNEEVGSGSMAGAKSTAVKAIISRLSGPAKFHQAIAKSFLLSNDMAHAVHPNYASYHEDRHMPHMNAGPVVKWNANMRYTTNSSTCYFIRKIAEEASVPLQDFVIKQSLACGSTIGPLVSADMGIRAVDLGIAQLSMHSIREQCGTKDIEYVTKLMDAFYRNFAETDLSLVEEEEEC